MSVLATCVFLLFSQTNWLVFTQKSNSIIYMMYVCMLYMKQQLETVAVSVGRRCFKQVITKLEAEYYLHDHVRPLLHVIGALNGWISLAESGE